MPRESAWWARSGGGLLALLAGCGAGRSAAAEIPGFDAARAWRDLEALVAIGPRPAGSQGAEATRSYLEAQLALAGLEPRREAFTAQTPAGDLEMANVVVDLGSRDLRAPIVTIGSHYDTKRFAFEFVGGNDGGSSTAVLLELARALAPSPPPDHLLRLVFFDGEEAVRRNWDDPDNRYGSRHHVALLRRSGEIERVAAFVLLDMVGDADLRLTRDTFSDGELVDLFFDAARDAGLGQHVGARAQPIFDDHLSFRSAGVPVVLLMDFEYGPNNKHWHSPRDTLENCSAEALGVTGRIVLQGLPRLLERTRGQR